MNTPHLYDVFYLLIFYKLLRLITEIYSAYMNKINFANWKRAQLKVWHAAQSRSLKDYHLIFSGKYYKKKEKESQF